MRNSPRNLWAQTPLVALAVVTIAACATNTKREVAAAMPMSMPMSMPMAEMASSCPLGLTTLALTPSQKATFDSVRTAHRAAMERDMQEAMVRARAVLTDAQRVQFDSASAVHKAMMAKMMHGNGCMD